MSDAGDASPFGTVAATLERTAFAVRVALGRRGPRAVFALATAAYLLGYLVAVGHLGRGDGRWGLFVVSDPLSRALRPTGPLTYEPVALAELGPVSLLVSPPNDLIGLVLAGLVGANVAVWYVAWRQPAACGIGSAAGLFAGLPALLSGAACCGPVLLIALGVQASAVLLSAFAVLVPLAAVLLVATLLYVGRRVDPAAVRGGGPADGTTSVGPPESTE
jgi:hypothetical protein